MRTRKISPINLACSFESIMQQRIVDNNNIDCWDMGLNWPHPKDVDQGRDSHFFPEQSY